MKKLLTLLLLTVSIAASAQLSYKDVLTKSMKVTPSIKDGVKGKLTIKMMGMGGTSDFATDGTNYRLDVEGETSWIVGETEYTPDNKKKTLLIENSEEDVAMVLLPWGTAAALCDETLSKKAEIKDVKMEVSKTEYEIAANVKGQKMLLYVDSKTFVLKGLKMKKGFITVMSIFYSDLTKLTDTSVLKFDRAKYSSYKVIDERGKEKKKK